MNAPAKAVLPLDPRAAEWFRGARDAGSIVWMLKGTIQGILNDTKPEGLRFFTPARAIRRIREVMAYADAAILHLYAGGAL